jgi:hypothetical protein
MGDGADRKARAVSFYGVDEIADRSEPAKTASDPRHRIFICTWMDRSP